MRQISRSRRPLDALNYALNWQASFEHFQLFQLFDVVSSTAARTRTRTKEHEAAQEQQERNWKHGPGRRDTGILIPHVPKERLAAAHPCRPGLSRILTMRLLIAVGLAFVTGILLVVLLDLAVAFLHSAAAWGVDSSAVRIAFHSLGETSVSMASLLPFAQQSSACRLSAIPKISKWLWVKNRQLPKMEPW